MLHFAELERFRCTRHPVLLITAPNVKLRKCRLQWYLPRPLMQMLAFGSPRLHTLSFLNSELEEVSDVTASPGNGVK